MRLFDHQRAVRFVVIFFVVLHKWRGSEREQKWWIFEHSEPIKSSWWDLNNLQWNQRRLLSSLIFSFSSFSFRFDVVRWTRERAQDTHRSNEWTRKKAKRKNLLFDDGKKTRTFSRWQKTFQLRRVVCEVSHELIVSLHFYFRLNLFAILDFPSFLTVALPSLVDPKK